MTIDWMNRETMGKSWIWVAKYPNDLYQPIPTQDPYELNFDCQILATETTLNLMHHLNQQTPSLPNGTEIQVTVTNNDCDEGARTGINEEGYLPRYFSSSFNGVFFKKVKVSITSGLSPAANETYQKAITQLIKKYFVTHPDQYSNWAMSHSINRQGEVYNRLPFGTWPNYPEIKITWVNQHE